MSSKHRLLYVIQPLTLSLTSGRMPTFRPSLDGESQGPVPHRPHPRLTHVKARMPQSNPNPM
jgi:hypothetical protein